MTRYALLTALALGLTSPAAMVAAQNLTKSEEGRVEVGKCYALCMDRADRTALALYARVDRLTDLLISDEYFELTVASRNELVTLEETAICSLAQDHVRGLDGCYAGCVDLESAYGVRSSQARNRFRELLISERDALRQVGLWQDYQRTATVGTDFDLACDRYWSDSGSAGVSRIAALPARVRAAEQRMARRPPPAPEVQPH